MSEEEKWYTYPEDEPDSGRNRRVVIKSIILGLIVALILGLAAYLIFSGQVADIAANGGGPIWITLTIIPFVMILVLFLAMMWGRNASPVFAHRDSRSIMFVIAVGLVVLGLAVMLYMFVR